MTDSSIGDVLDLPICDHDDFQELSSPCENKVLKTGAFTNCEVLLFESVITVPIACKIGASFDLTVAGGISGIFRSGRYGRGTAPVATMKDARRDAKASKIPERANFLRRASFLHVLVKRLAARHICCCTTREDELWLRIWAILAKCCSVYSASLNSFVEESDLGCSRTTESAIVFKVLSAARTSCGLDSEGHMMLRRGGKTWPALKAEI